jgi:SPP1 family predicted phage head-tail adaptor
MLAAGSLRHLIQLLPPTRTQTPEGDWINSYQLGPTVWAHIAPASGHRGFIAKQVRPDVTHLVTIRRHPGMQPTWRALYQGRYLNLGPPMDEDERRVTVTFYAVEIIPAPST